MKFSSGRPGLSLVLMSSITIVACGAGVPPPSLTVPLNNEFGDFALLVDDDSGLVAGGRSRAAAAGPLRDGVVARPELKELDVAWIGGACSHRPTLRLSGDATRLLLELSPDVPEPQLPFVACPAAGLPFGVTLTLKAPIEQAAVSVEVNR